MLMCYTEKNPQNFRTTYRTSGPGNCLNLSASGVWLISSLMSTISSNASWPSCGLFGSTCTSRPVGPNDALACAMINLCGVRRCGTDGSNSKITSKRFFLVTAQRQYWHINIQLTMHCLLIPTKLYNTPQTRHNV